MATNSTRKTLSDKDLKYIEKCYEKLIQYFPFGFKPYDNLVLMQDLVKAMPKIEISSNKEFKKRFWYAFISGFYSAVQFHSNKEIGQRAVRDWQKKEFLQTLPKDNDKGPDYSKGI